MIHKAPFFWINIAFILGITFSYTYSCDILLAYSAFLVSLCLSHFFQITYKKYFASFTLYLCCFLGGIIAFHHKSVIIDENDKYLVHTSSELKKKGSEYYIFGKIDQGFYTHNVILLFPNLIEIQEGDSIAIQGQLSKINKEEHLISFSYNDYFISQQAYHKIKVNQYTVLKHKKGVIENFRSKVDSLIFETFSTTSQGIAYSLLLGDKSHLSKKEKEVYQTSGSMHVLAISGMHVGILSVLIYYLLWWIKWFPKRYHKLQPIITCMFIVGYSLFVGGPPSIVRATMMMILGTVSILLKRKVLAVNIISIASFGLLLYDPSIFFSISYQLSFIAIFSISMFPYWKRISSLKWYLKIPIGLVSVGLVAQIGTLPLVLYYFHFFPVYGLISGLFNGLLTSILMYLGIVSLLLSQLNFYNEWCLWLFDTIYEWNLFLLIKISSWPQLPIIFIPKTITIVSLLFFNLSMYTFYYPKRITLYINTLMLLVFSTLIVVFLIKKDRLLMSVYHEKSTIISIQKWNSISTYIFSDNQKSIPVLLKRHHERFKNSQINFLSSAESCVLSIDNKRLRICIENDFIEKNSDDDVHAILILNKKSADVQILKVSSSIKNSNTTYSKVFPSVITNNTQLTQIDLGKILK
ncbi:ComEC/Rec2 family competence protein [Flammeovirga agarivorans]|uniref:ComEC/Rec2 family competence protein n=1 Tax=Flammeovirga agarivorans TaxID=2726742 RepID=A0A7X8SMK5_9BACT|nr:ComEC/Rec2 family competence protein [Flammeovirga agarivorans]NLR93006.1 ComEC/Rec2 family competence protein [Flammeovirga agarivorans]